MGAFSKALKDAQYLQPLSQSLVNYKKKQDEAKGRQQLLTMLDQMNQVKQQNFQPKGAGLEPSTWEQTPITNNAPVVNQPTLIPEMPYNPRTNIAPVQAPDRTAEMPPVAPQIPMEGNINTEVLGDYKPEYDPSKNPNDYRTAQNNIRGKFSEIIGRYAQDPNITPEQLNQVLQITQMGMPSAPLGNTIEKYNSNENVFSVSPEGVRTQIQKAKDEGGWNYDRDQSGNPVVYTVAGQKFMRKSKPNGEEDLERVPQPGENRTNITVDNTSTAEAIRQLRIGQMEKDLKDFTNQMGELDKKHNDKDATELTKKKVQEDKNTLLKGNIIPTITQIKSAIAQEFPEYVGTIERYQGDPQLAKDPKRIDNVIIPEMKKNGVPERMIYLTRDILKAQFYNSETLPK